MCFDWYFSQWSIQLCAWVSVEKWNETRRNHDGLRLSTYYYKLFGAARVAHSAKIKMLVNRSKPTEKLQYYLRHVFSSAHFIINKPICLDHQHHQYLHINTQPRRHPRHTHLYIIKCTHTDFIVTSACMCIQPGHVAYQPFFVSLNNTLTHTHINSHTQVCQSYRDLLSRVKRHTRTHAIPSTFWCYKYECAVLWHRNIPLFAYMLCVCQFRCCCQILLKNH